MTKWFLPLCCLFCACKAQKFDHSTYADDYITVGSGGGIAGIETSFHVLPNGAVYHTSSLDTLQKKLPPINRKVVRAALEKGRQLMDYAYQKPGNVYKFITLHIAGRANRIAWHEEAEVDARCLEAYKTIDKLINKSQL